MERDRIRPHKDLEYYVSTLDGRVFHDFREACEVAILESVKAKKTVWLDVMTYGPEGAEYYGWKKALKKYKKGNNRLDRFKVKVIKE